MANNLLTVLEHRLANQTEDPEKRLLRDFESMPAEYRASHAALHELVSRIVAEERLKLEIDRGVLRIEHAADKVLNKIHEDASSWAEQKHLTLLRQLLAAARKTTPILAEARRRAIYQIAGASLVIFVVAWFAIIGAMKVGFIWHPTLTEHENRQLVWARSVQQSGNPAAVEWATRALDDDLKLYEAQATIAALKADQNIRRDLALSRECRAQGMQVWHRPGLDSVCWFELKRPLIGSRGIGAGVAR